MNSDRVVVLLLWTCCVFFSGSYGLKCLVCGPKEGQTLCNATVPSETCGSTNPTKETEEFTCILMMGVDPDSQERAEARFCLPLKTAVEEHKYVRNGALFVPEVGNCYSDLRFTDESNPNPNITSPPLGEFCVCTTDNCNSLVALTKSSQVNKA